MLTLATRFTVLKALSAGVVFLILLSTAASGQSGKRYRNEKTKQTPPSFAKIETVVEQYFEKLPGFDPKGIITVNQTAPLFAKLQKAGWNISSKDRQALLDRVLPDGSFLVKQLSTPAGKKFAAQIYKYPDGFDRLDRLSRMPQGRSTVSRLISGPGGYQLIKYMTTAPGGKNLGRQLSNTPSGKDFNQPTGRIYTLEMLIEALDRLYQDTFAKSDAKNSGRAKSVGSK